MKTRARVDANHREIVEALERCGWSVLSLAAIGKGCPDLLCHKGGALALVEVKTKRGKLTPAQVAKQQQGWPVTVIRSVEEAMTWAQQR